MPSCRCQRARRFHCSRGIVEFPGRIVRSRGLDKKSDVSKILLSSPEAASLAGRRWLTREVFPFSGENRPLVLGQTPLRRLSTGRLCPRYPLLPRSNAIFGNVVFIKLRLPLSLFRSGFGCFNPDLFFVSSLILTLLQGRNILEDLDPV